MAAGVANRAKVAGVRSASLVAGLLLWAASAGAALGLSAGVAGGPSSPDWLIGQNAIALMAKAGGSLPTIDDAFVNQSTFVYGDTAQNQDSPSAFGMPTALFGSYHSIVAAFAAGLLPGKFRAVVYDNELWGYTPLAEQQNPVYYEQQTAQLLHAHGLLYIAAPAPDLMWAVGRPADSYKAFLAANMAAWAARYADIYDIQGQQKEADLAYFTWFAKAAAAQARAANPHVKVFVGLRTDSGTEALLAAYTSTASIADGYWLNVNGIPGPANDLLNAFDQPTSDPAPGVSATAASVSPAASTTSTQSPSVSNPASATSGTQSPSSARAAGSSGPTGTQPATATANRQAAEQSSPRFARSATLLDLAAAGAFVLPALAVVLGIRRFIKLIRQH